MGVIQNIIKTGGGENLGNANLTIDVAGIRKLILGGALSSDKFSIRNSADTLNYFSVDGTGRIDTAYLGDGSKIAINTTTIGQNAVGIGSGTPGLRTVCIGFSNVAAGQNGVVIGSSNSASASGACGVVVGYNNTHTNGITIGTSNTGSSCTILGNSNSIGGAGSFNNNVIAVGRGMTETSGNAKLPHTFMFGSYATTGNKAGFSYRSNDRNHLLLGYDIMNASYSSEVGDNWMGIKNGTADPSGAVDAFQFYSKDIVAGNAAPHFRTEVGDIIKLFSAATVVSPTGGATIDAEARTAIIAIKDLLIANGLMLP